MTHRTPRKPIAQFFFGSASKVAPDNRHGLTIALESPGFLPWLDYAIGTAIECCRIAGAKAVILWDAAGYSRGSYLSPDLIPADLLPAVDHFMASMRESGIRTGVTLRPPATDNGVNEIAEQAKLASKRWGSDCFYIDSDSQITDAEWARLPKLSKAVFISEQVQPGGVSERVGSFAQEMIPAERPANVPLESWSYKGWLGTHESWRARNRKVWSVIHLPYTGVPSREQNPAMFDHLTAQVRAGDALFVGNTWWTTDDARNVRAVYQAASKRRAA